MTDCLNCDNRKCMDCTLRMEHLVCVKDCPSCCFENGEISVEDEVRNRIAATIFQVLAFRSSGESGLVVAQRAADAVMRDLALRVERGGFYEVGGEVSGWRLATDWRSDDECA